MKAKTIKLKDIRPYENNPRTNAEAVRAVKMSIEKFGYQTPIIVDPDNVIIAGHTRYLALKELGWKEVEVLEADLPADLADEFRIVENRTSELAGWDRDRLIDELRGIDDRADIDAFFKDGELTRLFSQAAGMAVEHPSQAQIDQAAEQAATKMERMTAESNAAMVAVTCKCCSKIFYVR